jgi:hypothetical protein
MHSFAARIEQRYLPPVPNISYFPPERLEDPELRGYLEHAARHGTPRPESQAIRAHVPAVLRSFSRNWDAVFRNGVLEHRSSTSRSPTAMTRARRPRSRTRA